MKTFFTAIAFVSSIAHATHFEKLGSLFAEGSLPLISMDVMGEYTGRCFRPSFQNYAANGALIVEFSNVGTELNFIPMFRSFAEAPYFDTSSAYSTYAFNPWKYQQTKTEVLESEIRVTNFPKSKSKSEVMHLREKGAFLIGEFRRTDRPTLSAGPLEGPSTVVTQRCYYFRKIAH